MNRPALFLALLLFAWFSIGAQAAEMELKTFQLHHRSAQELIPIVKPLLAPGAGISGSGYTLFVRSTPQDLHQVTRLLQQLDTAPRNLVVTVHQGLLTDEELHGGAVSGQIGNGNVTLRSGGSGDHRSGGSVEIGQGGNRARVQVYRTQRKTGEETDQRLRVLQGQWARISIGQQMPVPQSTIIQTPGGLSSQQSIEYKDVSSGFEVRPQVSGDTVTMEVRPFRNTPAATGGGAIDTQSIVAAVSGRLGQWIELGGVAEEAQNAGNAVTYSTEDSRRNANHIYVKIDVAQ